MCCNDIFLGYVTLPANDKTRRLEYGALAWRLKRRLLNVIFITLRTAYVRYCHDSMIYQDAYTRRYLNYVAAWRK
ncbi:hypothetical protein TIFTF001_054416 [Ficus carica]|uniref:Uncharacterized protein n=1 Tax=Ficus carica TaxID=3494 RepID=A0AA88JJ99_FICCA|nr:hypothetical protein TIFTF001_054416 [Ficus carica]